MADSKSRKNTSAKAASDVEAGNAEGGGDMPAKEVKNIFGMLFPGKFGRLLGAFAALALAAAPPIYGIIKSKPAEAGLADAKPVDLTSGLPFKDNRLVIIVKGLDPHGKGCTGQKVSLSDPNSYGFETNTVIITKRNLHGFEGKFDSNQTQGNWSVVGRATPNEVTAAFALEGGGQGTVKLRKRPNQEFAIGWQTAHDCVGDVELACPAVMGPDSMKGTLRDDPVVSTHLAKNCLLLAMPEEKTVKQ